MLLTVTTLHTYYPWVFWAYLGLTLLLAGAGVGWVVALRFRGDLTTYDAVVASLLWCYVVTLLYFTVIGRFAHTEYRAELDPFASWREVFSEDGRSKLPDLLVNLALMAPVAFLFAELASGNKRRAERDEPGIPPGRFRRHERRPAVYSVMISLCFSLLIECLQYVSRTGTFEIDDIINNLAGAIVSAVVWKIWDTVRKKIVSNTDY